MKKRIPVDQLKPGMYMTGVDKSWLSTPFFSHKRLITGTEEIVLLKQYGIHLVTIDTERGDDVDDKGTNLHLGLGQPFSLQPLHQLDPCTLSEELCAVSKESAQAVEKIFEEVGAGGHVDAKRVLSVVQDLQSNIVRCPDASLILAQMRRTDTSLFSHTVDTSTLSLMLGRAMKLDKEALDILGVGALLHDVGYLSLPIALWQKRRSYSGQELELIQTHPKVGATLLSQFSHLPTAVRRIVLEHHERSDGSGYPAGHPRAALSQLSQIVSVSDTYMALVSGIEGLSALVPTQTLVEIGRYEAQGQFDANLVVELSRLLTDSGQEQPVQTVSERQTSLMGIKPNGHINGQAGGPSLNVEGHLVKPSNQNGRTATLAPWLPPSPHDDAPPSLHVEGLQLGTALERLDGDRELLHETITLPLAELPKLFAQVQTALNHKATKDLERSAHSLKGAVGNIGATAAFDAAYALEEIGRHGDLEHAEAALMALKQELDLLQPTLRTLSQSGLEGKFPQESPGIQPAPRGTNRIPGQKTTVLLVGGSQSSQLTQYGLLRTLGLKVIGCVQDATVALTELRHGPPDLVITDWNLPGASGVELLKTIRADAQLKDLAVLIVTGSITRSEVLEAKQYNVNGFLLRPFTTGQMEEALVKIIGKAPEVANCA